MEPDLLRSSPGARATAWAIIRELAEPMIENL